MNTTVRHSYKYVFFLMSLVLFSCSLEEVRGPKTVKSSKDEISFAAPATTRASIAEVSHMEAAATGFRVFGALGANPTGWYADGSGQRINGNNHHRYVSGKWGFSPAIFWPASGYPMNFYAVFPSAPLGLGSVDSSFTPIKLRAKYTVQGVGTQEDVLTAKLSVASRPVGGESPITFNHALSMIDFGVIAGQGTRARIQSLTLANIRDTCTYDFIADNWVSSPAMAAYGETSYLYYGTVRAGGSGGSTLLPTWMPTIYNETTANPIYSGTPDSHHLMLMPQLSNSWAPVSGSAPSTTSGGYISLIYRMETGVGVTGNGTQREVGFRSAQQHPRWASSIGYTGPLYVKAGFPLPATSGKFSWDKGHGYRYNIGLGTPNSCNGYILDRYYYDTLGNRRTEFELVESLREGKRVGDKLQDGVIHVTLGVEKWIDIGENPDPPSGLWVTPRYVALPPAAQTPVVPQTLTVTPRDGNGNIAPGMAWTLRAPVTSPQWLQLSLNSNGSSPSTSISSTGQRTVYLVVTANSGNNFRVTNLTLDANPTVVVSTIIQDAPNTAGTPPAATETYVGAFWKKSETGERIIRINMGNNSGTQSGNWGPWAAIVGSYDSQWSTASGDGVVLSTAELGTSSLQARNISFTSTAAPYNNPQDAESSASRVVSVSDVATGVAASGDTVKFRIGLQRAFSGGTPARYATVWLLYGTPAKVQKIFLRQGEGADYVMRPTDAINSGGMNNPGGSGARPAAVRFMPYNLTIPAGGTWNTALSRRGGGFTQYPTQTGAFFQWANETAGYERVAWDPFTPAFPTWDTNFSTRFWDVLGDDHETCPEGYRRFTDGISSGLNATGPVIGSELRQSLWLNPQSGYSYSADNNDNVVWGYYADGFFDRRQVVAGPGGTTALSSVSVGNANIANTGALFYNPASDSKASLFFPITGSRGDSDGHYNMFVGRIGLYWGASAQSTVSSASVLVFSNNNAGLGSGNNVRNPGQPIRCVQDVCVPLSGITLSRTGSGSVNIGSTAALTVSYAAGSKPTQYAWQLKTGPGANDWETIGITTVPSYPAPVLIVGTNDFRVLAINGCTSAPGVASNVISVTGVDHTGTGTSANVPVYIGAFWRATETGERIIRIPVGTVTDNNAGAWVAVVSWLDGLWTPNSGNGVVLAPGFDAGTWLLTRNIDWTAPTTPMDAESYKLTGVTSRVVMGNVAPDGVIEFRIGLQQNYTGSAPARYGFVTLSYANSAKWHRIFLRQGEAPDYVMRGTDASASVDFNSPNRPNAVPFSPYNLTANNLNVQAGYNGTGVNPGRFAQYPTQAGAYFQWMDDVNIRYAWDPHTPGAMAGWNNMSYTSLHPFWSTFGALHETCPIGYRRPNDGAINTDSFGTVVDSELRQSLFWRPRNGVNDAVENSVFGYYADGFFDRRQVVASLGSWSSVDAAVSTGDRNVAYVGSLFFNPYNYASLFFPAAGSRASGIGQLYRTGQGCWAPSSSVNYGGGTLGAWTLSVGNGYAIVAKDGFSATPIRCVIAPCTAIQNLTISPSTASMAVGTSTTLTASFALNSPTPPITYQWDYSVDGGATWIPATGVTTPTYNAPALIEGVTKYRVTVLNCGGTSTFEASLTGTAAEDRQGYLNLYVGAFWRHDQTGERLIRVARPASPNVDGAWRATVVVGGSWIELDREPSADPAVGTNSAADMNIPSNDGAYRIFGTGVNSVSGVLRATSAPDYQAGDEYIYFRIGLKGTIPSTQVRYGMVLLSYNNHAFSQRIFIRQGEAADYLMRSTDPSTTITLPRANVQRFSPYNLTDPALNTSTTYNSMTTTATGLLGTGGGTFVDYPTKTGYLFEYNYSTRAFNPVAPLVFGISNWSGGNGAASWAASAETCPTGYRRPTEGAATATTSPTLAASEIRQSLYVNPVAGTFPNTGIRDNMVFGYYADGFFDRNQLVQTTLGTNHAAGYAVVRNGTVQAGYIGVLFYNPNNYASLFFPAGGYRISSDGELAGVGLHSFYWTSTPVNATNAWTLSIQSVDHGNGIIMQTSVVRAAAFNVRCVVNTCTAITGASGNGLTRTPTTGDIAVGNTITLNHTAVTPASPTYPLTYTWQVSTNGGASWQTLGTTTSSSNAATSYAAQVLFAGTNQYRVIISNTCSSHTSNVVSVTGTAPAGGDSGNTTAKMYVGAFWRANEMGERIIRIDATSGAGNTGTWNARVMWRDNNWGPSDGVVLSVDALPSPDPTFNTANPGNAESYPVGGDAQLVSGTVSGGSNYITFRIGLKSAYNGLGARYAVVLLTYANGAKWQKIYLRQGHDADFLMRTTETGTSMNTRPSAVKFSPYNLRAVDYPTIYTANLWELVPQNGGDFTQFPTQAGAFFQWSPQNNAIRYAWAPFFVSAQQSGPIAGWNTGYYTGSWQSLAGGQETCPAGYRRPNDGPVSNAFSPGNANDSEVRQSLWANPQSGTSDYLGNSVWGYYADGFFDRRPIDRNIWTNNITPPAGEPNSGVSIGNRFIAHIGRLFFNPNTNASLFFPAVGYRNGNSGLGLNSDGQMYGPGQGGNYWTSSTYSSNSNHAWQLQIGPTTARQYNDLKSYGLAIRCVK